MMLASLIISIVLFFSLLIGMEVGRLIGKRIGMNRDDIGTTAADGVVFAVFGLIVAFTFSTSASQFIDRRRLIIDQANAMGTMSLRVDALDPADRTIIRQHMLQWLQLAEHLRTAEGDPSNDDPAVARAANLQNEVWQLAATAVEKKQQPQLWVFVMPPINEWIDLSTKRLAMNNLGTPPMVMPCLVVLSVVASVLAGVHMSRYARRSTLHWISFAGILTLLILVIFDLDHPRAGLIQLTSVDQVMLDTEQSIKAMLPANDELPR